MAAAAAAAEAGGRAAAERVVPDGRPAAGVVVPGGRPAAGGAVPGGRPAAGRARWGQAVDELAAEEACNRHRGARPHIPAPTEIKSETRQTGKNILCKQRDTSTRRKSPSWAYRHSWRLNLKGPLKGHLGRELDVPGSDYVRALSREQEFRQ